MQMQTKQVTFFIHVSRGYLSVKMPFALLLLSHSFTTYFELLLFRLRQQLSQETPVTQMSTSNTHPETNTRTQPADLILQPFDASAKPLSVLKLPLNLSYNRFALQIDNLLSAEECKQWINAAEQRGFQAALLNTGAGEILAEDVRKCRRCMIDDTSVAAELYRRFMHLLPQNLPSVTYKPVELNERFRILKYTPGGFFAPHFDGSYCRPSGHANEGDFSKYTLLIYLQANDGGCGTRLYGDDGSSYDVVPEPGRGLLFSHSIEHEGLMLTTGHKYIVRTDVMCRTIVQSANK